MGCFLGTYCLLQGSTQLSLSPHPHHPLPCPSVYLNFPLCISWGWGWGLTLRQCCFSSMGAPLGVPCPVALSWRWRTSYGWGELWLTVEMRRREWSCGVRGIGWWWVAGIDSLLHPRHHTRHLIFSHLSLTLWISKYSFPHFADRKLELREDKWLA